MSEITEVHSIEYLNDWNTPTIVDVSFNHSIGETVFCKRTFCVLAESVNTYSEVSDALLPILDEWVSGLKIDEPEVE